jgi:hypothetical protein
MMTIASLKGAGSPADVDTAMPVRRQPLLTAVLPTLPREEAVVERKSRRAGRRPRVKGARDSLAEVASARAELDELSR